MKNMKKIMSLIAGFALIASEVPNSFAVCNEDAKDVGTTPHTGCGVNGTTDGRFECSGNCTVEVYSDSAGKPATIKQKKDGPQPPANATGKIFVPKTVTLTVKTYTGSCSGIVSSGSANAECLCANLTGPSNPAGEQRQVDSGDLVTCGGS